MRGQRPASLVLALVVPLALLLTVTSSCSAGARGADQLRFVSVPFEDVMGSADRLASLEELLAAHHANAVAVSAGRMDWSTFTWSGHPERTAPGSGAGDPFGAAVERVGGGRHVSAVVDVFAERLIQEQPELAAVDQHGQSSAHQVSLSALTEGVAGERLLEMVDYVTRHYDVDSVDLTELHYDTHGLGDADLAAFHEDTGRHDWPRDDAGRVDLDDEVLGRWRSERVATFVERAAAVAHGNGAELYVDVRVSWDDFGRNSRENGQDYPVLLRHADRLVVWNYFALNDRPPEVTSALVDHLVSLGGDDFIVSVGLWSREGTVSADELGASLARATDAGVHVWVVPSSLLRDEHWAAVGGAWEPS